MNTYYTFELIYTKNGLIANKWPHKFRKKIPLILDFVTFDTKQMPTHTHTINHIL